MFESLSDRLQQTFAKLARRGRLSERDVDAALREVRLALLEADVNFRVVRDFVARVRERTVGAELSRSLAPGQQVAKIVYEELIATLGQPAPLSLSGPTPHSLMLVGLQGSGKTTTAAKLALHLRKRGLRPLLVAADTRRPAAIQQLVVLGKQLDIPVHTQDVQASPVQICAQAREEARKAAQSPLVVDTAGRLHIDGELMDELGRLKVQLKPTEVLLVADAMTGQDAVRVAEEFHARVGLTGLVLTKMDGDARGGAAISMRSVTGVPIKFLGVGEKLDALEAFQPERLASRISGMGDILGLIERTEEVFAEEEARRLEEKLRTASFDLEDFREQLVGMRRMGPLDQILEMVPGLSQLARQMPVQVSEAQLTRVEAIINSMTSEERRDPRILNASRKRRIARGSGTSIQDVNQLLNQFRQMQRLIKLFSSGDRMGLGANILSMFR